MAWKIINDPTAMIDDGELLGISIMLINCCGEPKEDINVYYRAWRKIQSVVDIAMINFNK